METAIHFIKCKNCGNEVSSTAMYCSFCGSQLHKTKKNNYEKKEVIVPEPKQLESGNWQLRLMVDGKKFSITEPTYSECKAKAIAIKSGLIAEAKKPKKMTLNTLLEKYVNEREAILSPCTVRGYESMRKNHFKSVINTDVSQIHWQSVMNEESKHLNPKTVKNLWGLVSAAMKAYGYKYDTPKIAKARKRTAKFLDYKEIQEFLKAIEGCPDELMFLLALHSLRQSEILALNPWSISDGMIHVNGAVVPNKDNKYVYKSENKTYESTRDIPVMIPRLIEIWPKNGQELKFSSHTTVHRRLKAICVMYDLPVISLHCLRHSFASLAYHLKWGILTTMKLGGWSTPDCVQKIYTHLSSREENDDIKTMKEFFNPENNSVVA